MEPGEGGHPEFGRPGGRLNPPRDPARGQRRRRLANGRDETRPQLVLKPKEIRDRPVDGKNRHRPVRRRVHQPRGNPKCVSDPLIRPDYAPTRSRRHHRPERGGERFRNALSYPLIDRVAAEIVEASDRHGSLLLSEDGTSCMSGWTALSRQLAHAGEDNAR